MWDVRMSRMGSAFRARVQGRIRPGNAKSKLNVLTKDCKPRLRPTDAQGGDDLVQSSDRALAVGYRHRVPLIQSLVKKSVSIRT